MVQQTNQVLPGKLGNYSSRITNRVASTLSAVRGKSHTYGASRSFDASRYGDAESQDAADPKGRHLQLHNTVVRALLVDEVLYEPSRLLRKNRKAVLLVTGADLVLVKMTKDTSTASAAADARASSLNAAAASSCDGGAAAEDAQASVLAQHELTKMIKCVASGSKLELEFIVTGSARFKVSAAALGFSSGGTESPSGVPTAAAGPAAAAGLAVRSSVGASAPLTEQDWQVEAAGADASTARRCKSASEAVGVSTGCSSAQDEAAAQAAERQQQQQQYEGVEHSDTPPSRSSSSPSRLKSPLRGPGSGSLGRSSSYVRSLGSSVVDGAMRSRLVKTDDGEYWVNVEAFTLQFRDETLCQMAASLLSTGRASMRTALEWLKQGLPCCPEFAITHITECSSRGSGTEVLVAGPTAWGTELQLPDSWVEAVQAAQLPEEQPLLHALEVPDGPAAFKVHLATPAGLAEVTLLPEMLALLARQANPQHTGQLLAVPVRLRGPGMQAAAPQLQVQTPSAPLQDLANSNLQLNGTDLVLRQAHSDQALQQRGLPGAVGGATGAAGAAPPCVHPAACSSRPCSQGLKGAPSNPERLSRLGLGFPYDAQQHEVTGLSCYDSCVSMTQTVSNTTSSRSSSSSNIAAPGTLKTSSADDSSGRGMSANLPAAAGAAAATDASVLLASPQTSAHRHLKFGSDVHEGCSSGAVAMRASSGSHKQQHAAADTCMDGDQQQRQERRGHLRQEQQQQQQQQDLRQQPQHAGLRARAKRAAKRLMGRVTNRMPGSRSLSGPPGVNSSTLQQQQHSGGSTAGSKRAALHRCVSSPGALLQLAASVEEEQLNYAEPLDTKTPRNSDSCGVPAAESGSSLCQHGCRSSGELPSMKDAADGAAASRLAAGGGAEGSSATANTSAAALKASHDAPGMSEPLLGAVQQQQPLARQRSDGSSACVASAHASENSSSTPQAGSAASSVRGTSRRNLSLQQQQQQPEEQEELHLSFMPEREVYAVIHVQLLPAGVHSSAASSVLSRVTSASPFAQAAAEAAAAAAAAGGAATASTAAATAASRTAPGILVLGNHKPVLTVHEQQLLSAAGLLAGLLCCLGALLLRTPAGRLLVVAAVVLNAACMVAAAKPTWLHRAALYCRRSTGLNSGSSVGALGAGGRGGSGNFLKASAAAAAAGRASPFGFPCSPSLDLWVAGVRATHPAAAAGATADGQHPAAAAGQQDGAGHGSGVSSAGVAGGLRLRLLRGGFMREALGLLEEQISAYASMREQAGAAAAGQQAVAHEGGAASEAAHHAHPEHALMPGVVLLSKPEPDWMTPDWRYRIIFARPNLEERRKLARIVHSWRVTYAAHQLVSQLPPHFSFFQQQLGLKPLLLTPQGYVVLLLKMHTVVQVSRSLVAAGLRASDMVAYCGFLWSFMFEVLAPHHHPAGRLIMIADMRGIKLGQAVAEGQIGARAIGDVCAAWPERLSRCLVLGAPSWFNMLYRMVRPHLSPNTRAKVQVMCDAGEAAAELARCLGPGLVPKEYGGLCGLPYDEFPAQKQLLQYVAKLQQQR